MSAIPRIFLFLGCVLVLVVALFVLSHRDRRPQIYFAAASGDTNSLAQYFAKGKNVNALINCEMWSERTHAPLLDVALAEGQLGAVEFLLRTGANPNQPDSRGMTPIMWVINSPDMPTEKRTNLLRRLVAAGAELNGRSSSGLYTPLIQASDFGQADMVEALLGLGADIRATNGYGLTPLHYAGSPGVARILIGAGAERKSQNGGETPAEAAARRGRFDTLAVITNEPVRIVK
jgi:hypothetical protein